jgi:hypothetical protein
MYLILLAKTFAIKIFFFNFDTNVYVLQQSKIKIKQIDQAVDSSVGKSNSILNFKTLKFEDFTPLLNV